MSTINQTVRSTVDDLEEMLEPWQNAVVALTSAAFKTMAPYANAFTSLPLMRVLPEPREYIEAGWSGIERLLNGRVAFAGRVVAAAAAPLGHETQVKVATHKAA